MTRITCKLELEKLNILNVPTNFFVCGFYGIGVGDIPTFYNSMKQIEQKRLSMQDTKNINDTHNLEFNFSFMKINSSIVYFSCFERNSSYYFCLGHNLFFIYKTT
jgi:hypothetical protein